MFTEQELPELEELTPKQRVFVLSLPEAGWNMSQAARMAYGTKYAGFNTSQIKTAKVQGAIRALRCAIETKAVADAMWTFEESRRVSLEILEICRRVYEQARTETEMREAMPFVALAQRSIHELNVQHGYIGGRPNQASKAQLVIYLPEKNRLELPSDVRELPENGSSIGLRRECWVSDSPRLM
jgi:hypothetical protein